MKIIFSDLDGTFLDHKTYSFQKSIEGVNLLVQKGFTLVFVSSKTFLEMKSLHQKLKLSSPFIFENGGGIAFYEQNEYRKIFLGKKIDELLNYLPILEKLFSNKIFPISEMSAEKISTITGLPLERAKLAKTREVSCPFITEKKIDLDITEIKNFNEKLTSLNIQITKGGRFYHLISKDTGKGNAIKKIISFYKKKYNNQKIKSVAIGDSENDLSMLELVDYPFLVKKNNGIHIKNNIKDVIKIDKIGPEGFTEAIKKIIDLEF